MTGASQPRMIELERQGNRRAALVNRLSTDKERMIGTILLGNNLVNILASAMATSLLIVWVGDRGVAYATLIMTALVLIFAEVLPKTYAINNADRTALAVAPILRGLVFVLGPISQAIHWIVVGTLRIFGVRIERSLAPVTTEDELRGVISMHTGPEPEVDDERAMLRSILDLADVEVSEIMTHRSNVAAVDATKRPPTIVRQVLASPHTRLPIFRDDADNVTGVIHAKDLLRAVQRTQGDLDKLDIDKVATKPWFIPESTSLLDQLREFRRRREHFAIVVDEYGALMGIVTLEDILEEIVGDISDEHDVPVPGVHAEADGSFIINGDVTIRDLNRELDWDLPDNEAATLAGLVMHEARRIPDVKQAFAFHGFRFQILRRDKLQITSIRVSPLDGALDSQGELGNKLTNDPANDPT